MPLLRRVGPYFTNYEVKDGHLVFTRKFVQRATTIPAEQSPVVLARK